MVDSRLVGIRDLLAANPEVQLETLLEISKHSNVSGVSELIVELAGSRIDSLRTAAAQSLESSVQATLAEVPALMVCLTDNLDGEISYWAATLLGRLGQQGCCCNAGSMWLFRRFVLSSRKGTCSVGAAENWAGCKRGDSCIAIGQ